MKDFKLIGIWAVISLIVIVSHTALAEPAAKLGINPCPSAYVYNGFYETTGWNICIKSGLYSDNEDKQAEDFKGGCPLVDSGDVLQAWNPDAGACFRIQTEADETLNDIFTVTRDATKNLIRIDLYDDVTAAGCYEGASEPYLLSPNGVYCLKDIGDVDDYSFAEIEAMADAYFGLLFECRHHDERQLQLIVNDFERYLEFAYYSNPNIKLEWGLSARSADRSTGPANNQQRFGFTQKERCKTPNVSRVIGVTNY